MKESVKWAPSWILGSRLLYVSRRFIGCLVREHNLDMGAARTSHVRRHRNPGLRRGNKKQAQQRAEKRQARQALLARPTSPLLSVCRISARAVSRCPGHCLCQYSALLDMVTASPRGKGHCLGKLSGLSRSQASPNSVDGRVWSSHM